MLRILREFIEYSKCIREELKATLSEMKKNPPGTNSERKETEVQVNDLEHKEGINNQLAQNEEIRIQKNEEIIWYLSLTAWLISLSIMLSSSIHAVAKGISSFFLSATPLTGT